MKKLDMYRIRQLWLFVLLLVGSGTAWAQNVAKIGSTEYATLVDAIAAAPAGQTVTLLADVNTTSQIEIGKQVTLDLNGKTIEYTGSSTLLSGVIMVLREGDLTINDSSNPSAGKIKSGSNAYAAVALTKAGETSTAAAKLTVNGGTLEGDYYAITGNGSRHGTEITINGGTIKGAHANDNLGIYHPQDGVLTITGGSIEGYSSAVELRSGTLNVSGGTFTATCPTYTCNPNGSGTTTTGAAIAIAQHNTNKQIVASITNGTFIVPTTTGATAKKLSVSNPQNNTFDNVTVSGLSELIGESVEVPAGYAWNDNGNGTSSLATAVAQIGTTGYATLEAAIAAATAGQTVTLLQDITLANTVAINKDITIDGGDYTVTKSSGVAFELTGSNDVTFTNLNINVPGSAGRAIQAGKSSTETYSGNLTVTNSTLTVSQRGVSIYEPGGDINLAISNTTIQSTVEDPTTTYVNADTRGVALWSYTGQSHNVTLTDTDIKGFSYCINVGGTGEINELTMNGGSTYGRAAINNHGKNGTFNLTGVDIHGLNNQTGPTEAFACILDDRDAANNIYNISNCTITSTISEAASSAGGNASQYLVDLRGEGSDVFITDGTTYTTNNEERGGLIEYYSRLDAQKGNTINFDAATYETFDDAYDFANVPGLNTTGNSLTYVAEVYYYWSTGENAYEGSYCDFAVPFAQGWLDNGEFIKLQRDVTLSDDIDDIICQLGTGSSFYLELNGKSLDANGKTITLNGGVSVLADAEVDGLFACGEGYGIVKSESGDANHPYKYSAEAGVAQIGNTIYSTLAAAVGAANDGDVINILADIHELEDGSELVINKSVTITGPVGVNGEPVYTITGKSDATGTNDIFITGDGEVTLSNLYINNFGNNTNTDAGHAPVYVSTNFTGKVNLVNLYISDFNRGGIFLYGGEFNVDNCYIDCANSRSGAFTKGIEIKGSANGIIQNTAISNMERAANQNAAPAGIEIYGSGSVVVDECMIVSDEENHQAGKATYGIVSSRVGAHDPSGGTLHVTNTMTYTTNGSISVSDNDQYGPVNNYTIILDECDFDNYISTWSATSSITVNSGSYAEDVYADAGSIIITGGEFTNFAPYAGTGTIAISGGIFDHEVPVEYCAEGYSPITVPNSEDLYTVEKIKVAQIGDVKFETLEAAFAAVQDGQTITLLQDVSLTDRLFVNAGATPAYAGTNNRYATTTENKSITLDLDGHNITSSSNIALAGGTLNITGTGTIETTEDGLAPVEVRGTGDLTQKRTLTIGEDVTLTGSTYGLNVFGSNNAQKNVIDVNVNGTVNGTLFVLGNLSNAENEININVAGTVAVPINDNDKADVGIALNGNAAVTVAAGANISGETGIEVRAGQLTVNGGTITATVAPYSYTPNGNGSATQGAAIAVAQHGTKLPITTTLNGGTLTGVEGSETIVVADVQNTGLANVEVTATEGYTQQAEIPANFAWQSNGDETYTLVGAVAQIGTTGYATLEAAFAAVQDGQTITLLQDISLTNRLFVNAGATPAYAGTNNRYATTTENKSITLNLNGHDITSSSNIALAGGTLNITGTGTIETTEDGLAPVEVRGTGDLTQKRTLTIGEDVTLTGSTYGLNVFGSNNAQKNVIDVNVNGTVNGTLFVLGNLSNAENEININVAGTVAGPVNDNDKADVGIALNGNAAVTVADGAQISGESGIEVRAGQLTVNGGTITAMATTYSYTPNGSGSTTKGAAIAVAQHTTALPVTTTLNGGTLDGTELIGVTDVNNNMSNVSVTAAASFVQNTATELPEGYGWILNGNGTSYSIGKVVAQITHNNVTTSYATLKAAIDAAQDGDEVVVVADGPMGDQATVENKTVTIVGAGTITTGGYNIIVGTGGTVNLGKEDATTTDITFDGNNVNHNDLIRIAGGIVNMYDGVSIENVKLNGLSVVKFAGSNGTFKMFGGSITDSGFPQYAVVANESGTNNTFNMSGGEVESPEDCYYAVLVLDGGMDFNMTGGTLTATKTISSGKAVALYYNEDTSGDAAIFGGRVNGLTAKSSSANATITATGGTFNWDCEDIVADGYTAQKQNTNPETWVVINLNEDFDLWDGEPYAFTENAQVKSATYHRTFNENQAGVGRYQAWYVPFDYKITEEDTQRAQFYKINMIASSRNPGGVVEDEEKIYVYIVELGEGDVLRGNRPYVIEPFSADQYDFEVTKDAQTNKATLLAPNNGSRLKVSTSKYDFNFYGTYDTWAGATEASEVYAMKGGYLCPNESSNFRLGSYRWYIKPSVIEENGDYAKIRFIISDSEDEDDATGIDDIASESDDNVEGYYAPNGTRLNAPVKGLNIVKFKNGKARKIYVK